MSDDKDRPAANLVPAARGEVVPRSTSLVRRGLDLLHATQPSESANPSGDASQVDDLRERAERGDAEAQYYLGLSYYRGQGVQQDYARAAAWYRKSAEQGNDLAQFFLGSLYQDGEGVPQDYVQAAAWFRKAAEQGLDGAQFCLSVVYHSAYCDAHTEAAWFRKAAEQGDADAQLYLGVYYREGRTVPQDDVEAHKWFSLSASRRGSPGGCDELEKRMTSAQIAEAQRRAAEWLAAFEKRPDK